MKQKLAIYPMIMLLVASLAGCESKQTSVTETAARPVKVTSIAEESVATGPSYIGIVKAKDTKNYSFLTGGKLSELCVEKGQLVKAGDVIARLDVTSMEYQRDISSNTKEQAEATLQKTISTYDTNIENAKSQISSLDKTIAAGEKGIEAAETALDAESLNIEAAETALATLEDQVNAAREINKVGGYASLDLDSLESTYKTKSAELVAAKATHEGNIASLESKKAELETAKASKSEALTSLNNLYKSKSEDVAAAQAAVKSASTSSDIVTKTINDSVLVADSDGYIMELPYKVGETVAAGYPVAVVKSKTLVVTVGASDAEYSSITVGQEALINGKAVGKVATIAQYPNESTRQYAVDVDITGDYTIGETVDVKLVTGYSGGCYVPMDAVFNVDGVDYVYAVNSENRIYKKQVVLGNYSDGKIEVQIDDPTAMIVAQGVKSMQENELVSVEG
jgi:multidrug efflux pump subunit AcrA (membrane-fusion protein)